MNKEEYEKLEKHANALQHDASAKMTRQLELTKKYFEGYNEGIEDLLRFARRDKS